MQRACQIAKIDTILMINNHFIIKMH
ncbi:hypothetical protein ENC_37070 [Enterobacter hormaechei]|nr:hypothetical protein ENC_37070 [Enterobacter hormaechei]